ncbi:MAG: hypothetical protein JOZ31_23705 [Verrucomicrobia bacterium]|nr:hypothetical protein [Verrucomicrobiota bacterium]
MGTAVGIDGENSAIDRPLISEGRKNEVTLSALRPNQKGTMDVMNSSATVDKVSVFVRSWIVNVLDR